MGKRAKAEADDEERTRRQESRDIRACIAKISRDLHANKDDYLVIGGNKLKRAFEDLDEQSQRVQRAPDQAAESEVFANLVKIQSETVQNFYNDCQEITPDALAASLISKYGTKPADPDQGMAPEDFDWVKFGNEFASGLFRSTCCAQFDTMLGPLRMPRKIAQAKRVAPRKQTAVAPAVAPAELDVAGAAGDAKDDTTALMEAMFQRVQQNENAPFSHLIMNHDSFSQVVENMFSLSILVANGKVILHSDPSVGMRVESVAHGGLARGAERPANSAMIMGMNMEVWNAMKEHVSRADCLTPHRSV